MPVGEGGGGGRFRRAEWEVLFKGELERERRPFWSVCGRCALKLSQQLLPPPVRITRPEAAWRLQRLDTQLRRRRRRRFWLHSLRGQASRQQKKDGWRSNTTGLLRLAVPCAGTRPQMSPRDGKTAGSRVLHGNTVYGLMKSRPSSADSSLITVFIFIITPCSSP